MSLKNETPARSVLVASGYSTCLLCTLRLLKPRVPAKAIKLYLDMIEEQVRGFTEPSSDKLLPDLPTGMQNVSTLVLGLYQTLLHFDWKIERGWRTLIRPGVDAFLKHLAQFYEIVVYTDAWQTQTEQCVDPLLDRLDENHYIAHRLTRAATRYENGKRYLDLSKLNRDLRRVIYISGHALESCLQPENCVEIKPWKNDDLNDTTLLELIPFLEFVALSGQPDIRQVLESYKGRDTAKEFIERSKEHQRMSKHGKRPMVPSTSTTQNRGYLTWTPQMDAILASTLIEQIAEGNKGDGDFKPQAYQAVVDKLRDELSMQITEHAKNRLKIWKKHHATITDIRTYTKFKWNEEKKMIEVEPQDYPEWLKYCKENSNASAYLNKRIDNWDDICTLVAVDRAIGDGAEQHEESAAAMEAENEAASISKQNSGESSTKKLKRDRLADAVSSFADSFKEYVQSKNPPKADSKEVYDIVSGVLGLSRQHVLKATKRFLSNIEEFEMLKNLPEEEKLDWILLCLE